MCGDQKMNLLDEFAQACAEVETESAQKDYAKYLMHCWKHHSKWSMERVNNAFIECNDVTIDQIRKFPHGGFRFEDYFTVARFMAYNFPDTTSALSNGLSYNLCKAVMMQEKKTNGIQIAGKLGFGSKRSFL